MLLLLGLSGGELIFHGHQVDPVALPLLLFPAGATDSQFFQNAAVQLFELVFGSLVNNDPVRPAADDLLHRHFPGAQHPFPQQGHAKGAHHQGGELAGFDVEGEAEHPPQLFTGLGDHLAVDHPAVALRVEVFTQGVGRIHQDHVAHLTDPVQRHPARQAGQETGQGVVPQPHSHHFTAVDIDDHFTHHPKTAAGVTGDHLGAHQFGAQPEAIAGYASGDGVVWGRGRGQARALGHGHSDHCGAGVPPVTFRLHSENSDRSGGIR